MGGDDNRRMNPALSPRGGALRLNDWGVIRAHGDDAAKLLHSQLTQDVEHLDAATARPAGYCSPKGRLLASFVMWRPAADDVLLACSADLLAAMVKRLSMFVLRAKVRISDASSELAIHGLAGEAGAAVIGNAASMQAWQHRGEAGSASVIRLGDALGQPRYLLVQAVADAPPAAPALSADEWAWLEVHSGLARIVAATADQFVPQMLNYEVLGAVDFRKGCYPGQEVVARSQYRGTIKRRTQLFVGSADARPGDEVFHSADPGQPAGLVANAARLGDEVAALVEVKLSALESGSLHLGAADGALLQRAELPYALPLEPA